MTAVAPLSRCRTISCRPSRVNFVRPRAGRRLCTVTASLPKEQPITERVVEAVDVFLKRYDVVSAGVGALAVTAFCVACGQEPLKALSITCFATVTALVLNELLFSSDEAY